MKHKRKRRRIITAAVFLVIFIYLAITIVGLIKEIREKRVKDQELKAQIQQAEEVYNKLVEEQQLLDVRDPEYMEKLARDLGMLKDDEILFEERDD